MHDDQTTARRLLATLGPTLAGLAGGKLAGLAGLATMASLARNAAVTYSNFPSLAAPTVASVPEWAFWPAIVVGLVGPAAAGAMAAVLPRSRDTWEDASAGLTAALAATLAAVVSSVGAGGVLAHVVVPSIADLTALSATPERLPELYPDLRDVSAEGRGPLMMAKVVADQCSGSARALPSAALLGLSSAGVLAFAGTLAAGHLRRRGDGLLGGVVPYLELTVPGAVTFGLIAWAGVGPVTLLAGLAAASVAAGAVRRWPAVRRVLLALAWAVLAALALRPALA